MNPNIQFDAQATTEFYSRQYFESLAKIDKINEKKFSLLKTSLLGTFGYFGWLIANLGKIEEQGNELLKFVICFLPLTFNIFGFLYNLYFKRVAEKYSGFTTYILSTTSGVSNIWQSYQATLPNKNYNFSQFFWCAICAISALFGILALLS